MACPACGKPLLVPNGQPGKPLPCPKCRKQLVLAASGLDVVTEASGQLAKPAVRPKRAPVPVTAPSRNPQTVPPEPSPPVAPPAPPLAVERQRSWWFVPVAAGSGFMVAISVVAAVWMVLPSGPDPNDDKPAGPSIVNPLESYGRTSDAQRARLQAPQWAAIDQAQTHADGGAVPGQRGAAVPAPKPAPRGQTATPAAVPTGRDGGDAIQAVLRSVAVVINPAEGHGSGFVAAPGILVTNHHVIADAIIRDLQIKFPDNAALNGRTLRAELMHVSMADDLAFLAIDANAQPLVIKAQYEHANGHRVVAVGSPGSGGDGPTLENLTTDGRLGPELKLHDDGKRWALSMAVNGGNSGGPLVDAQTGEVMGVIVAKFTKTEAQSLAIPHSVLVRELAEAGQASKDDRAAALSQHRQRYCLRRMAQILRMTSFAFDRSIDAALENADEGAPGMDAAFNECKTRVAEVFAEQFADFSGAVGGEVEELQGDPHCDPRIRRGLHKLLRDIEGQADEIRRRVPRDEIEDFLGRFRGSVESSRALMVSLAERMQMDAQEDDE